MSEHPGLDFVISLGSSSSFLLAELRILLLLEPNSRDRKPPVSCSVLTLFLFLSASWPSMASVEAEGGVIIEDTLGMFKEFISSQTVRKTIILPITISNLTE